MIFWSFFLLDFKLINKNPFKMLQAEKYSTESNLETLSFAKEKEVVYTSYKSCVQQDFYPAIVSMDDVKMF